MTNAAVEHRLSASPVPYPDAVAWMEARVAAIREEGAAECLWFLEHPPLYTAGTSARAEDLLNAGKLPVYQTGRGGQYTYHGPGQRVVYVMLDLKMRAPDGVPDLRGFVHRLEAWLIAALADLGVTGERREGRIGIWVATPEGEKKIAALGIRIRRGIGYHGVSINVAPDLSHFSGIIPCGLRDYGVTSLTELGAPADMDTLDAALKRHALILYSHLP